VTAPLLTADEVAARLRVPRTWVYRAAREGTLPSVQCGRYRRFDETDVDRWIGRQRSASANGEGAKRGHHGFEVAG
jgi:excisionase family DNA binding protein